MTTTTLSRLSGCPFLRPDAPSSGRSPAALYCRLPRGRIRVPEPAEIALYCAPGNFEDCPTWKLTLARQHALEVLS